MGYTLTVQRRTTSKKVRWFDVEPSPFPAILQFDSVPTVGQLKTEIKRKANLDVHRQRLTTANAEAVPLLDDNVLLDKYAPDQGCVVVKDLGPQISWRTVFLTEYAGPLLLHPALYLHATNLWRTKFEHSQMQRLAFGLVLAHYAKREVETVFVHRFSNATMPAFNIIKNSAHYWILSGVMLGLGVYGPGKGQVALQNSLRADNSCWNYFWTSAMLVSELGNLICHVMLSNLRPPGTRVRKVPRGFLFELVSCPNYFFEMLSWVAFTFLTGAPVALLFTMVSTAQMLSWALKKHRIYRKEFKDYPRNRKAMIPFVI